MKKIIVMFFVFVFILNANTIFAQTIADTPTQKNLTFKEIQNEFYNYWKDKTIEKGRGYKPFKRWEWYWETRLLPNGNFPPSSITHDNWKLYQQSRNQTTENVESNANWTFKGPSSSAGGYNGLGRINCIAFHPTDSNTFWVGTPAGGLWKTINAGLNWTTNTDNLPVLGISDIAIDPTNPNIMYIATGDGEQSYSLTTFGATTAGDTKSIGVLKSIDGGNTWFTTWFSFSVNSQVLIRRLIINPVNPQILIAATSAGIWRTTNGGTSWSLVQSDYFMDVEFKPTDPTVVYAATFEWGNAKIYRSTTSGSTWTLSSTITLGNRINLAVSAADPTMVDAVVTKTDGGLLGLWYSNNSGASFTNYFTASCNNNMLNGCAPSSLECGGQGSYDLAYAINPNNANDIWLGGVNTYRTIDAGTNWYLKTFWTTGSTNCGSNPGVATVHADKHFFAFHPLIPNTLFECNDGGLYKTKNGGATWTDLSNGLGISQLYRLGTSALNTNVVITGLQDNGTKGFANNNWDEQTGGDGMECIIDYTNTSIQYASYVNGILYRTQNSWIPQNTYTTISNNIQLLPVEKKLDNSPNGAWVTPFVIDPTTPTTLFAGYKRLYKTIDRGNNWLPISPQFTIDNLRSIAIAPSNANTIYAATFDTLFNTNNQGVNWFYSGNLVNLTKPNNLKITYIAVHTTNPQILWVTVSGYVAGQKVFQSNDGGATWTNISGTLPNVPANCIVYQNGTNNGLYVGTDLGVYYRNGTMSDWIPYNTGLPNVIVTELEISYNNNKLWAATFGRGLWSSDFYTLVPLKLLNFTATLVNKEVQLNWSTTNEINTKEFEIEKSYSGNSWEKINTVKAANISGENKYATIDNNTKTGTNYYRLKMIDIDGKFEYSQIRIIEVSKPNAAFVIAPNPATSITTVYFNIPISKAEISIYDVQGRQVFSNTFNGTALNKVELNTNNLLSGVYIVNIKTNESSYNERLVINK